ncbi:MAG: bifunctional 5,10-methylenetetrahydrofolate dehydrogenase/5,10-methenyltetrahydrofolate cyclohydrolase [Candidatus Omnitrophica bacterium]|nr:bifunctional 5,10-methylenetetrahydrofolate dehydrogenase/5,10-methenyltetrahydrofolate cyclohydrolase [Candidatus Omnitrophota bacterium]
MPARILDGKLRAGEIKRRLKEEIAGLKDSLGYAPRLAAVQIGTETPFSLYVNSQKKVAEEIGIEYRLIELPASCKEKDLVDSILSLNDDESINGIILQSPLPGRFDMVKLSSFVSSDKDAEGVNPENKGKLLLNSYKVVPPTASAVMELLAISGEQLKGREAVIIGHSGIVGKPLAMLLLDRLCTVTVCHVETYNRGMLLEHIRRAEVLVVSVGKPELVKGEWIRPGAVVIDVGINMIKDKIVGDVEYSKALGRASHISPVPGGVGPLTTIILMRNCIELFKRQVNAL